MACEWSPDRSCSPKSQRWPLRTRTGHQSPSHRPRWPSPRSCAREAILRPVSDGKCPLSFSDHTVAAIIERTAGYPYFIQFFCREVFDVWIAKMQRGEVPSVPVPDIVRQLDADFFHGRWAKATHRQRELLQVVSELPNADQEFTVQDVVAASRGSLRKPFTSILLFQHVSYKGVEANSLSVFRNNSTFSIPTTQATSPLM
jgi:hypothetical protein